MSNVASVAGFNEEALNNLRIRIHADISDGQYFGGSVVLARGGTVGYRAAIGEVSPGRAAADDDIYLQMSVSKSFTAALILRAIDQGRFQLDTRAAEILPYFGAAGKQNVTIYHLLTHTGGTYAGLVPSQPLAPTDMGKLELNVRAISAIPIANVPGGRVFYNPFASYAVLAQILVETDQGRRSFSEIAKEDLFEPLGMRDASYGLALNNPRRVMVSHAVATPTSALMEGFLNSTLDEAAEHPAGGGFGTIDDIFRFADTFRNKGTRDGYRLLSPSLLEYATRIHTGEMSNGFWDSFREANGWPDFPANFSLLGGYARGIGHHFTPLGFSSSPRSFGAVGGGSTFWMVDPDRDLTVVFLGAGFLDGLHHLRRLRQIADLAVAACED